MLVTTPFLLLLFDYWITGKMKIDAFKGILLAISVLFGILPFRGQPQALSYFSPLTLVLNLPIRYLSYLQKFGLPFSLAVYPPVKADHPSLAVVTVAAIFLLAVTGAVIWERKKRPYLFVGWFWFLIGLMPTMGGNRFEDRYMYFPIIGLLIMAVWGISEWLVKKNFPKSVGVGLTVLVFAWFIPITYAQTQYWKDSIALFSRSL